MLLLCLTLDIKLTQRIHSNLSLFNLISRVKYTDGKNPENTQVTRHNSATLWTTCPVSLVIEQKNMHQVGRDTA